MKTEETQTITKVFTKYDMLIAYIYVPMMPVIELSDASDDIDLPSRDPFDVIRYEVVDVEEGLEGVRFLHYEQEKK